MPRATETFLVVFPGDVSAGLPAQAIARDAFKEGVFEPDGPDWLTEVPAELNGVVLEEGMTLSGLAHIFVERGDQVRPESLQIIDQPVGPQTGSTIWD